MSSLMSRVWKFSDLEFAVLWGGEENAYLPRPLSFTSRTPMWNDYMEERARTRDALRGTVDPRFDEVLAAIRQPDIRIEARGWDARDWTNTKASIRLLAARRGERGFLVTQLPGETVEHSSGFTVSECEAVQLADVVVDALPDAEPGKRADIALATQDYGDEMDYGYGRSVVHDSFEGSVRDRATEFLATPAPCVGRIDVIQVQSIFGPRGTTRHRLKWRDLENDGRYLIDDSNPPVAMASDRKRLIAAVNTRIAEVVRAIKDERIRG
ncbi:ESX secretion-associated protein EspG [Nocardia ninae]|nr:ESX secretion-associated protein EspG [Nocardia ninae]